MTWWAQSLSAYPEMVVHGRKECGIGLVELDHKVKTWTSWLRFTFGEVPYVPEKSVQHHE